MSFIFQILSDVFHFPPQKVLTTSIQYVSEYNQKVCDLLISILEMYNLFRLERNTVYAVSYTHYVSMLRTHENPG